MTAPTPESLGALFAEVWDLCDQYAATITDAEVDEKLDALLGTHLEEAFAEPLPPCMACPAPTVRVVNAKCHVCNISIRVGFCVRHLQLARMGVARGFYPDCSRCSASGTIRFEGLS